MKKITYLLALCIAIASFMAVSCAKHVSPAAVEEPVMGETTGVPTINISLSPAASATATSTGSVMASPTPTYTHTFTKTLSATFTNTSTNTPLIVPTSTATNTAGSGYRLKTFETYSFGVIMNSATYSYASGGLIPATVYAISYDSAGLVSTTASAQFDMIGNTANMSVYDDSGNLVQRLVSVLSAGKVERLDYYDGTGANTMYQMYQYNTANQITRIDTYDSMGVIQEAVVKAYNAAGMLLSVDKYQGATVYSSEINTYNSLNLISKTETYSYGALYSYTLMEYDATGKIIADTLFDYNNVAHNITSYIYDAGGKLTETHVTMPESITGMTVDTYYTYNAQNLIAEIRISIFSSGVEMVSLKCLYTYESF